MEVKQILVIDDERNVAYSIKRALDSSGIKVEAADSGHHGIERFRQSTFDSVIVDVRLPDISGLEVLRQLSSINCRIPVIVMTAYSAADTAIEAIKHGAFDYLVKPVDLTVLRQVVDRALQAGGDPFQSSNLEHLADVDDTVFTGQSAPMQEVYKLIGRYSRERFPVLILGESGTGKELAARSIHKHSKYSTGPFVAINCAAIPESLLESELFGHEKGSFSGADKVRIGRFEQAMNGTIFLDEIGDMPSSIQAKILRVIQDQNFERIGGTIPIVTNARIVAATNRDLDQMVVDGTFRSDLLYRLNCLPLKLPPLRERSGDIHDLSMRFLASYNQLNPDRSRTFHPSALAILEKHKWPGNVRELANAVNFSAINSRTPVIFPESLPVAIGSDCSITDVPSPLNETVLGLVTGLLNDGKKDVFRRSLSLVERIVIREVLRICNGNQVQASEILGLSRTTLRSKCMAHGLTDF